MQNKYLNKLIAACKKGNLREIKKIVSNELVDINQVDSKGFPPIYYAVIEGHMDVVSYLISKNVNLNISVPAPIPDVIEHTLLEDCLIDYRKTWYDKFKMARLLLDNGYDKYYTIEDGSEHLLDISIMFIQKAHDFELLKFLFKNFETIHMKIQLLDEPIPLDSVKEQGLANFINEKNSSQSSLASIFNVSSSIPMLPDKLIEALNEAILENELENIPIMIFRLGAKINTLDDLIKIVLDKCDDYNYFQRRRAMASKNNINLKFDILSSIQEKLEDALSTDIDIQLINFDYHILGRIYEEIVHIKKLNGVLISKEMEDIPRLPEKNHGFFTYETWNGVLNLDDEVHLHLLTNDPHKEIPIIEDMSKVHSLPPQINNVADSNISNTAWSDKNTLLYTMGSMLLLPVFAYSIRKYFNFVKKIFRKKYNKDKLIHAIQHDMDNVANSLVNRLPANTINKCDKYGYTLLDYAFSKNNLNFMKTLIDKGANTSIVDSRKKNLLMQSIEKKSVSLSLYLIDKVDLSSKDALGKTSLIYAIENNMPTIAHNILDKLIEKKLDLFSPDSSGKDTLVYAIQYNMNTVANKLLDNLSYDINRRDEYGYTLLNYAFSKNNLDFIKILINRGADATIIDSCKKNLLMQSIEKKSVSLSSFFIDKVDLSLKDTFGKGPLIYAIENNMPTISHSILNKLIEKGVNLSTHDSYGKNALMYAIQYHINDVANTLINYLPASVVNEHDSDGYTSFDYACVAENKEIIVEFLKKGFKISNNSLGKNDFDRLIKKSLLTLDTLDKTFLDIVSKKCFTTLAEVINRDIHIKNTNSNNIFMYCCKNNLNSIANLLLRKGNVIVNAIDSNNETPLSYAIKNNNTKMAKYLIQHGANVDVKDKNKKTLLMFAIENKNIEIINKLLSKGSDVLAKDKYRKSVLDYAVTSKNTQIINIIKNTINATITKNTYATKHKTSKTTLKKSSSKTDFNATTNKSEPVISNTISLIHASETNNLSTVIKLLSPSNVDTCDEYGKTCLMYACENGSLDVANYLIENNASINKLDLKGKSPLYYACQNNHIAIVKKLVEHGVSLGFEKPDFGFSIACQQGYMDIVKLLVENKIPIDPIYNVKSPLMFACEAGKLDIVKYLVDHGADVNLILERNGYTMMDFAKKSKNPDVINYITSKCSNITIQTNSNIPEEKAFPRKSKTL